MRQLVAFRWIRYRYNATAIRRQQSLASGHPGSALEQKHHGRQQPDVQRLKSLRMRFYKLLCLARPRLPREELADTIRTASTTIFQSGGQILDIESYGDRPLEYHLKAQGERYNQVSSIWLWPDLSTWKTIT